jgi:hypothetical protein
MQIPMATFTAVAVQRYPAWFKKAATATFLLLFIKGSVWLGATWLALRGFNGL